MRRQRSLRAAVWLLWLLATASAAVAEGRLSANQRISSEHLGYDLQYRIYRPTATSAPAGLLTLYITDGQWYLAQGDFKAVLDEAIGSGQIEPVLVVFLDSRNPDDLSENRRNEQFMCNVDFARFFAGELIPEITGRLPASQSREDRVILGLSFGGLNSACFGLLLPDLFGGIAMQSPASGQHLDIVRELYEQRDVQPLRMFLSYGTKNDNQAAARRFQRVLEEKGYDLRHLSVREGHDWNNWGPLLDDVLLRFFSAEQQR